MELIFRRDVHRVSTCRAQFHSHMPTRRTSRSPASSSSASSRRGSRSGSDTSSLGALSSQPSNRGGCHTRTLSNSDGVTPGDTASPLAPDDAQNNNAAPLDAATGLPAARHGALTASIINMLLPPPPPVMVPGDLEASTSDDHALRSLSPTTRPQSPSALRGPQSPGTSTTMSRPSTEQGKHALSKESLDVLRAERIARRMEQEQQRLQQQQAVNSPFQAAWYGRVEAATCYSRPSATRTSRGLQDARLSARAHGTTSRRWCACCSFGADTTSMNCQGDTALDVGVGRDDCCGVIREHGGKSSRE